MVWEVITKIRVAIVFHFNYSVFSPITIMLFLYNYDNIVSIEYA